jgi:hypothetical protein
MAWTVAVIDKYSVGPKTCHVLSCTADAATQNVATGLKIVDHFQVSPQSGATAALVAYPNVLAAGTTAAGYIGFSAAVSGDVFYVYAFGR